MLDYIIQLLISVPIALFSLSLHEFAHGYVANKLGDPTAKRCGRLSLNPLRHLDLMGTICMVIARIGWAKPVPIDCRYFRNPKKGMALTAAAGPLSNLFLAVVTAFLHALFTCFYLAADGVLSNAFYYVALIFYIFFAMNLCLALFNLIPIPPFDGSRVLFVFLPDEAYFGIMRYERYIQIGFLIVFFLLSKTGLLSNFIEPILYAFLDAFYALFSI